MLENISLFDVLAAPTESKTVASSFQEPVNLSDFSEMVNPAPEVEDLEAEEEDDYDAVHEAEKLVNLFDVGNSILLTPLAGWKLQKNRGGKQALNAMKPAYMKRQQGEALTDKELALCASFDAYKADLILMNGEIPYSKQQREQLIKLAIPYCEKSRIKTNETFAFWTLLAGTEIGKITKILMA